MHESQWACPWVSVLAMIHERSAPLVRRAARLWHNRPMYSFGRRVFRDMRNEGAGAGRESFAIGLGIFIGCLPVFGFHLLLCLAVGRLLRLNRLKMYLAANISNPVVVPTLLFLEVQAGSLLRRGTLHPISVEVLRHTAPAVFGLDIVVGSVAVGVALGVVAAALTYASARASRSDPEFLALVAAASERYLTTGITAWEFARGKMRGDPLYRTVVCGGVLQSGGTLLDIGCGSGLTLALLAEARTRAQQGTWPASWPAPPVFERLVGVDIRPRVVALANEALGAEAEISVGDAREASHAADAVLLSDVLHMIPFDGQSAVLAAATANLRDGGAFIVREADASAGWRFTAVRVGNRIKALAFGHWRQRFYFRTLEEWQSLFATQGLSVTTVRNGEGTPFASVLFRLTAAPRASATGQTPAPAA